MEWRPEPNPIARSWYLTGALELEGAVDPAQVLAAFGQLFSANLSVADTVRRWRYQLDAEKAKGVNLAVGIRAADSGEEITVRIRNRVLHVEDGLASDADVIVEVTPAQVTGKEDPDRGFRRRGGVGSAPRSSGHRMDSIPHAQAVNHRDEAK